jgi:hypothetical protein
MQTCQHCRRPFKARHALIQYCSGACHVAARSAQHAPKPNGGGEPIDLHQLKAERDELDEENDELLTEIDKLSIKHFKLVDKHIALQSVNSALSAVKRDYLGQEIRGAIIIGAVIRGLARRDDDRDLKRYENRLVPAKLRILRRRKSRLF